ncbi:hypothetical protein BYT27DRAFT_7201998 [Phlegmacium glaucopus]|nr:hypothetical protein BYT27DRAFT_7201998 [Phlegmacium glaucopus]
MKCRADRGLGGILTVLFAIQELSSRDPLCHFHFSPESSSFSRSRSTVLIRRPSIYNARRPSKPEEENGLFYPYAHPNLVSFHLFCIQFGISGV